MCSLGAHSQVVYSSQTLHCLQFHSSWSLTKTFWKLIPKLEQSTICCPVQLLLFILSSSALLYWCTHMRCWKSKANGWLATGWNQDPPNERLHRCTHVLLFIGKTSHSLGTTVCACTITARLVCAVCSLEAKRLNCKAGSPRFEYLLCHEVTR